MYIITIQNTQNYTKTKFLLVTIQTHNFWPNANKIEIIFCLYMCIWMGETLSSVSEHFFYFKVFWVKNAKIDFLKKISVFSAVFIEIQVQVIATCLVNLKKHKTLDILLMTNFLWFF